MRFFGISILSLAMVTKTSYTLTSLWARIVLTSLLVRIRIQLLSKVGWSSGQCRHFFAGSWQLCGLSPVGWPQLMQIFGLQNFVTFLYLKQFLHTVFRSLSCLFFPRFFVLRFSLSCFFLLRFCLSRFFLPRIRHLLLHRR